MPEGSDKPTPSQAESAASGAAGGAAGSAAGGAAGTWADLAPRVISAIVLLAIGLGALWAGGMVFLAVVLLAVGAISWEIMRMVAPGGQALWIPMAILAAASVFVALYLPGDWGLLMPFGVALVGAGAVGSKLGAAGDRRRALVYLGWVMVAGWGLIQARDTGVGFMLFLVAVVVATDVAGYFVGRLVGGPKFWPRISPKKTWSGTVGGWIAAAIVGVVMHPGAPVMIAFAVALSFASQMGDAAESALKRAKGVKDASALIPGHGGVFDRFDALMAVGLVIAVVKVLGGIGG